MTIQILFEPLFSTSASFDFNLTRNQIIELAHRKIGGLSDGQTLTAEQYSTGSFLLNAMIKNWSGDGIHLWNDEWITVPLVESSIVLGSDGFDYKCIRSHLSDVRNQPITGEEYTSFWEKLTTSTGNTWVSGQNYLSLGDRKLNQNILNVNIARIRESESTRELTSITRDEYFNLANTARSGKPVQYWFRRQTVPEIYFYPFPDSATKYVIEMSVSTYPEDFDVGGDFADFIQEWIKPMVDGLAVELAMTHGIFGNEFNILKSEARESRDRASMTDHEKGNSFFQPDLRR